MLPQERLTLQRRVQQQLRMQGLSISKDGLERLLDFPRAPMAWKSRLRWTSSYRGLDQLNCKGSPRLLRPGRPLVLLGYLIPADKSTRFLRQKSICLVTHNCLMVSVAAAECSGRADHLSVSSVRGLRQSRARQPVLPRPLGPRHLALRGNLNSHLPPLRRQKSGSWTRLRCPEIRVRTPMRKQYYRLATVPPATRPLPLPCVCFSCPGKLPHSGLVGCLEMRRTWCQSVHQATGVHARI